MPILTKQVVIPSYTGTAPALAAGGAGAGFRVEPDPTHVYPQSVFPVTVRAYVDDTTFRTHVMYDARGRFPSEGFQRLELLAPQNTKWLVTTFTTQNDWDEPDAPKYATTRDTDPGGGDVLRVHQQFYRAGPGFVSQPVNSSYVPCNAMAPGNVASVLAVDASGRLRTVTERGLVLLASGTKTVPTGGQATESLSASLDTSGYRLLVLRVANVSFIGGTSPAASPVLRSVTPAGLGGAPFDLELYKYTGGNAAAGGSAEVQVGSGFSSSGVNGSTRSYGGRIMQTQPLVTLTGSPTGYTVPWELWGEA